MFFHDSHSSGARHLGEEPAFSSGPGHARTTATAVDTSPTPPPRPTDVIDRRSWLEIVGASMTAAIAGGCERDVIEHAVPYVRMPEEIAASDTHRFATTMSVGSRVVGLLATSFRGRPIKLDGNPLHPASRGGSDATIQAALYSLYDADRSQTIRQRGEISSWNSFLQDLTPLLEAQRTRGGAGLRLLTERVVSPTLRRQLQSVRDQYPQCTVHEFEPDDRSPSHQALQILLGRSATLVPRLDRAQVIVSLDADFLAHSSAGPAVVTDFMKGRDTTREGVMSRIYVAESTPSITGASADHRLAIQASSIPALLRMIGERIGRGLHDAQDQSDSSSRTASRVATNGNVQRWCDALLRDLDDQRGASLVVVDHRQPWPVHAAAYLINQQLGNLNKTIDVLETDEPAVPPGFQSLQELCRSMEQGEVELLFILGSNPVYTAPTDFDFAASLAKVRDRVIHLGPYLDETSQLCHWHLPQAHFLESWSDARAYDGTVSMVQPLIAPLFEGRSIHQLIGVILGEPQTSEYDWVRRTWLPTSSAAPSVNDGERERVNEEASKWTELLWATSVRDGQVADSAWEPMESKSTVAQRSLEDVLREEIFQPRDVASTATAWELTFVTDPTIYDGRFANNGWLQELPKPWSQLTWDNAIFLSSSSADQLGVTRGDWLQIDVHGKTLAGPAFPLKGMADRTLTVSFGYGRTAGGRFAKDRGINAYAVRQSIRPWTVRDVTVRRIAGRTQLATTQDHFQMEGRAPVREQLFPPHDFATSGPASPASSRELTDHPPSPLSPPLPTLYPENPTDEKAERAWGMVIDLTKCVGCKACVVACQAENNVPIVGKEGVLRSREMHWLRIDTYLAESMSEGPNVVHQPMLCQHCEHAPCEVVCPVAATTHSSEGLNEMTYNRCVGTRYCSNNCPYKVRRFNFFNYVDETSELARLRANPDVTVRTRGVMEKCTYCVQRINAARRRASTEAAHTGEPLVIRDGSVVTACQAACPAKAIVFGDLLDPNSELHRLRELPHHYGVLEELGTRPRTTYLAHVTHPSPHWNSEESR